MAWIKLDRAFFRFWSSEQLIEVARFFSGYVSDIDPLGRMSAVVRIRSMAELLAVQWPRMTYESQCVWHLYGAGCSLSKNAWGSSGNTAANGNTWTFPTNLGQANNYFDLGTIRFTAGNNVDVMRTVKSYSAGNVTVVYPLPYSPAANESFVIHPGCDKTLTVCSNRFTNSGNFRGFPYIPSPEAAY
jgi:uncharacterized phage protein (TIGR02218 family)